MNVQVTERNNKDTTRLVGRTPVPISPKKCMCISPVSNSGPDQDHSHANLVRSVSNRIPLSPRCRCTPCVWLCWPGYNIDCALHDRLVPSQKAKSTPRKAMDWYCSYAHANQLYTCSRHVPWNDDTSALQAWEHFSRDRQTQMAVSIATKSSIYLISAPHLISCFAQQPTLSSRSK